MVRPKVVRWTSVSPSGRFLLEFGGDMTSIYDTKEKKVMHRVDIVWNNRPHKVEWSEKTRFVSISGKNEVVLPFMEQ